jgi:potassium channel subfamily K
MLSNVIAFFLARKPASRRRSDPERGPEVPHTSQNNDDDASGDEGLPTGSTLVQGEDNRVYEDHSDDAVHMDIDDEQDENAIIREVEREEYLAEEDCTQPRHRMHRSYRSFSTLITDTVPSHVSRSWTKLRAFINTKTSLEDLESFVPQYRYLPILSGVIIPFSILLEVPGLTEDWYIRTVDNKVAETRPNTVILDVGLGFSLLCGVIANICLYARFLEKKIKLMTFLCVIFLTIHGMHE